MKPEYKLAALAGAMALAWGTASAQDSPRTERAEGFSQSLSHETYLKGKDLRASELVGGRVRNAAGENLGEIEELVIPTGNEDDMLVIVSVGGVLDVGDKLVALPYDDLRVSPDGDTFYFDRTEEQLKAAPAFTFEAEAEAQARSQRQAARDTQPARADTDRPRTTDDTPRTADRPRATDDTPRTAERARNADDTPRTAERPRATTPSATAARSANVVLDVFDYRASDLIGATVLDDRGESVAKVDDVVLSTDDDKLHAVLAIGGFAGFGAKLISIPFDDLRITSDGDNPQVRIAMTGAQLDELVASRPEFRYERPQVAQAPANAPRG
jgi:sporulation protein YlmC with PRC-barrel domain